MIPEIVEKPKMDENKILHVMVLDKFLPPFIDFIDENFGRENHHYVFITGEKYNYGLTPEHNVEFLYTDDDIFITFLNYMKMAKKIIIHGLWRDKVDNLLYQNQELLKKCYWVMWGGDFYFPETKSKIRHEIIKKIPNVITLNNYDYEYIKTNYNSNAKLWQCAFYPKNLFKEISSFKINKKFNILVGNSATFTNRHFEVFDILNNLNNKNFNIYCPLSYGDKIYAQKVKNEGENLFGKSFVTMEELLEPQIYLNFLEKIDIAIFNQNRQQGGGNLISLLGFGKTVYMSEENNMYKLFKDMGLLIFSIKSLLENGLNFIAYDDRIKNIKIIKNIYSEEASILKWKEIFNDSSY